MLLNFVEERKERIPVFVTNGQGHTTRIELALFRDPHCWYDTDSEQVLVDLSKGRVVELVVLCQVVRNLIEFQVLFQSLDDFLLDW